MNQLVPSRALCALVEPFYPKAANGRPLISLEHKPWLHFLQHRWSGRPGGIGCANIGSIKEPKEVATSMEFKRSVMVSPESNFRSRCYRIPSLSAVR
jgi:hypothetical protein